jgi:hypothetical protein
MSDLALDRHMLALVERNAIRDGTPESVTAGFGITVTRPRTGQWVVNHGRYDAAGYRTWRDAMARPTGGHKPSGGRSGATARDRPSTSARHPPTNEGGAPWSSSPASTGAAPERRQPDGAHCTSGLPRVHPRLR